MAATLLFLSSGLLLGWSLGANDAANVFGTAVAARMVRFRTAAIIASICVVLGAVLGGAGAAEGVQSVGNVNTMAGSFTVALSAALAVTWMTRSGLPVSTSQAIIGAIVAWDVFAQVAVDRGQLLRVMSTWVCSPLLAAVVAWLIYHVAAWTVRIAKPHLLWQDQLLRSGLLAAGAFGAYSLGANNIGNVMGAFLGSHALPAIRWADSVILTEDQTLFLIGALAITSGIVTYSRKVMYTVGRELLPLNPLGAWVAIVAQSVVLLIFSSQSLNATLLRLGLPPVPLIPVSSSQAIVGAVFGVGLAQASGKALRGFRWQRLVGIAWGWVITPLAAGIICFVLLYIVQNVFQEPVYAPTPASHP